MHHARAHDLLLTQCALVRAFIGLSIRLAYKRVTRAATCTTRDGHLHAPCLLLPGRWLLACQNGPLQDAGMKALMSVAPSAAAVSHAKAPAGKKAKHDPVSSLAFLSSVRA